MDHRKLDQLYKDQAQNRRSEVPSELWQRLEHQLDTSLKRRLYMQRIMKVAAVLLPMLIVAFLLITPKETDVQIVDLSISTHDDYYDHYRDFIKSEEYAQLLETYKSYE
ncbi:MAG: hypothetical protein R3275_08855 [Saprospiraceae bacterium]|nr:hypothetical protein [Saprospiraceae bacterium]